MVRTILFDMGGVLMEDEYTPYVKKHRRALSLERQKEFDHWEQLSAMGKLKKSEFSAHFNEAFGSGAFETVDQKVKQSIATKHNTLLISQLPILSQQYKLALLSNNMPWWSSRAKKLDFMHYFTPALFSDEIGMMKPFEDAYLHALKTIGDTPSTIMFIDDSKSNIVAAEKVGFSVLHYTSWEQPILL